MNELSLPNKDRKGEKSVLVFVFMPTYLPYKRTCQISSFLMFLLSSSQILARCRLVDILSIVARICLID